MALKIFPEPIYDLYMFQKNYQALSLHEKLIMHLTIHELSYPSKNEKLIQGSR